MEKKKKVQSDQRVVLSPSPSNILSLALLYGILPQHFHSLQAMERTLFPGLKFRQYLLHNVYIYTSINTYTSTGYT